jgi:hypothetical protein
MAARVVGAHNQASPPTATHGLGGARDVHAVVGVHPKGWAIAAANTQPPAFKVPAPGQVTVLSVAFPGAVSDRARSRLVWAAGPVAAGPDGTVLIADIDSDGGRVVVVARDGARSRFGGANGPTVGPADMAVVADGTPTSRTGSWAMTARVSSPSPSAPGPPAAEPSAPSAVPGPSGYPV